MCAGYLTLSLRSPKKTQRPTVHDLALVLSYTVSNSQALAEVNWQRWKRTRRMYDSGISSTLKLQMERPTEIGRGIQRTRRYLGDLGPTCRGLLLLLT